MALNVALIQPQIPPNTGNIARLCVATDTPLHLIEPLGFSINDANVRRAGLDYWDRLDLWIHPDWFAFRDAMNRNRCLYFSARATLNYLNAPYRPNSCLVFGSETEGMPLRILEKHPERCFTIPMSGPVRSLNLANAVSIVLYEAIRQTGQKGPAGEAPSFPIEEADTSQQQR
jgi:tRNA (cytidine/uridine-2'-O-)-methyltransferase